MRWTQTWIPTTKEIPADAEIISHQLMIRAGLMKKLASGTYTYLPLGLRVLEKITAIVREEMNRTGAQEILMPALQPYDLWKKTGRNQDYGENLMVLTDRHGRKNVLGPTHEEVVTSLVADHLSSYKQLPTNLYQIQIKFRDEYRPRFGVLRSREFLMKDAYSFHASLESLEETYQAMYDAYCRIFSRCGLDYVVVEAESGPIGGAASHEFMIPTQAGEDTIVRCRDCDYAANLERAECPPPAETPTKDTLEQPEDVHTPKATTIEAVCKFLNTQPHQMIKTLIFRSGGGEVVIGLVRGDHELNESKLAAAAGVDAIEMADEETVIELSGAAVGFAGPRGIKGKAKIVTDHAVAAMQNAVSGANRTDYHTRGINPGRDFPLDGLADIRNALPADRCARCGGELAFSRGIEVGHVFKLGTKYSEKLNALFLDENGKRQPAIMGCYGIGINRIMASAIETGHDADGIIWPGAIAPFHVIVLPLNMDSPEVVSTAEHIHDELESKGIEVLLDDRSARAGFKFKDADLIGIPWRVVVGDKGLKAGHVELKSRTQKDIRKLSPHDVISHCATQSP